MNTTATLLVKHSFLLDIGIQYIRLTNKINASIKYIIGILQN